jgi:ammonia channel protein AmtB
MLCCLQGLLVVGIFAEKDALGDSTKGREGLIHGGGPMLLGIQALAAVCIAAWAFIVTYILTFVSTIYIF